MANVIDSARRADGPSLAPAETTIATGRQARTPSGLLLVVMTLLWFTSLPLAITNRNVAALGIYAVGLVLCGLVLFTSRSAVFGKSPRSSRSAEEEAAGAQATDVDGEDGEESMSEEAQALTAIEKTLHLTVNGQKGLRLPSYKQSQLWHVSNSLNYLLARLEQHQEICESLEGLDAQARTLVEAVQAQRSGHVPAWPKPSGTPLDRVVAALRDDVVVDYSPGAGFAAGAGGPATYYPSSEQRFAYDG